MKSLRQLFVEFYICAADENEVVAWACEAISENSQWSNNKLIVEIAGLKPEISNDREEIGKLFNKFFSLQFPDFRIQNLENEKYAKQVLKKLCADFLAGRVNAGKLCRVVFSIEPAFDYPKWLGDLWNVCDGANDLDTRETNAFLADEA